MKPVNLLPQQHRARRAGGRQGAAYAVVGVLAALVLMAFVYTLSSNQANSRTTQANQARQEADRLEASAAQLGPFGDFAQIKQTRLAAVRQLAGDRFDWERLLRELAHVLPGGSWLQTTDASVTGQLGGASGGAASGAAAQGTGQPRAELVGCTPHQGDVARMLVRMRQLSRVEDVQLNESAQADNGDQISADSCGKLYQFDVTINFSQNAAEAPRGATKVPAALGGGS